MGLLDYSSSDGDRYHAIRHKEILENRELINSWSGYAMLTYFPGLYRGEALLEVGAGTGVNIALAASIARVKAVEPSEFARDHCRRLGIDVYPSLDEIPDNETFDRILIRHVLEHIAEPRDLLLALKGRLKERGKLILVLPTESPFKQIDDKDLDHHLYCWNRQTIANLLMDCEYNLVSAKLNWFNGRRIFIPIANLFGPGMYAFAMQVLGRLRLKSEILVIADAQDTS